MTIDQFRKAALKIPTALEMSHMNHPDFRVSGKIFASLGHPDEKWGMVKLAPGDQRAFIETAPDVFKPCNGAWGRQGCTYVNLPLAKTSLIRNALESAAKNVSSRKKR